MTQAIFRLPPAASPNRPRRSHRYWFILTTDGRLKAGSAFCFSRVQKGLRELIRGLAKNFCPLDPTKGRFAARFSK
jgi:hypothetical protein